MNNNKNLNPELLIKITRGNNIETLHNGWICVLDKNKKVIYKKGDINNIVFLRSTAKSIQAIPIIDYKINVTQNELAIICASHTGSSRHINLLKKIQKKFNLNINHLQCGIHSPLDDREKKRLIKEGLFPNVLHNNCSGKHLGMLAVCKKNAWETSNYLDPKHPLQKLIFNKIKKFSEAKKIDIAIDGCSAPTFAMPIVNVAKTFSNFTNDKASIRIINAIKFNPYIIGGKGHIDSEIIKASSRKLISKVGADGIIIVAFNGNCAVVKIADGSQKARSIVILSLLKKLGWLKENDIRNSGLSKLFDLKIKNLSNKIVGEVKMVF